MDKKTILLAAATGILGIIIGMIVSSSGNTKILGGNFCPSTDAQKKHVMQGGNIKDSMAMMMIGLEGKTGDEFDKAYIDHMIVHHEGAVKMAQAALTDANRQEIKDLSTAIITAQNKEITLMKKWRSEWYTN